MYDIDFNSINTPAYIVDERILEDNLKLLASVIEKTGCRILLAQKGFSMFAEYPLIGKYLCGTTASSLYEARLGKENMPGETHIFAPAYSEKEFPQILSLCDHIVFNSLEQWLKFRPKVWECDRIDISAYGSYALRRDAADKSGTPNEPDAERMQEVAKIPGAMGTSGHSCGIRVNPGYAEVEHEIYNPCCEGSRLGTTLEEFEAALKENPDALDGISGIHFHALCEQGFDTLERVLEHFFEKFGKYIRGMKWVNFGGGHHITKPGYDIEGLISCINKVQKEYGVTVYLEPGEAVALNAGYLASSVMDVQNKSFEYKTDGGKSAMMTPVIMDASAACHMPDVLEMPYRPFISGSGLPGEKKYNYRLGGNTCLAGDIIGDYSFDEPLKPGDVLVFTDMAHYSMVKNNTFNGIALPSILAYSDKGGIKVIKEFGYEDFKGRLS